MEALDWFKSVAGVAGASVFAAQFLKKTLVEVTGFNKIPIVAYVFMLSAVFTWFAHSMLGTLVVEEGSNFWVLMTTVVTSALVAVGGWEAVTNLAKPLSATSETSSVPRNFFGAKKFTAAFLAVTLFTGTACATRGGVQLSPEGTLAVRGNQLVSTLRSLSQPPGGSPLELLVASKTITPQEAIQVAQVVQQSLVYAQDLATVLRVVDEAKDVAGREQGLQRAAVLVQQIQASLNSANLSVLTEGGRKAVLGVLAAAYQVLLTVGSLFPAAQIPPAPAVG